MTARFAPLTALLFAVVLSPFAVLSDPPPSPAPSPEGAPPETGSGELPAAAKGTVYSRLYDEFTSHPNRLVGSDHIDACFQALATELSAAGLEPRFQTYPSLVQKTDRLVLTVDGAEVPGALMLDNGVASWVRPEPLSGPVVYAGDGQLASLEGKDLAGAIAVLDIRHRQAAIPEEAFMHGAKAVVIVGDGSLSQWDAVDLLVRNASLVPAIYLDAEAAEKAGLLDGGAREASIDAFSRLVDTEGRNLYVVLPGEKGWKGSLDTEEILLLSATLDTYGFTPDYAPDCRRAANASLLADVLCRMAAAPHRRTVVGVFFGSSYAAVEGARHFYYPIALTDKSLYTDDLHTRRERLLDEKKEVLHLLELAGRDDVIDSSDPDCRTVAQAYKKILTASVNRLRDPIGKLNLERAPLAERRDLEGPAVPPEVLARIAEIDAQIKALKDQKNAWNNLLSQTAHRRLSTSDPANMAEFRKLQEKICARYRRRIAEIDDALRHCDSGIAISDIFENRSLVAHFDFDFASDDHPWLFTIINAYGLFRFESIDTGRYQPALSAIGDIWRDAVASRPLPVDAAEQPETGNGKRAAGSGEVATAPLFESALTPFYKPFSLCVPAQRTSPTAIAAGMGIVGFGMQTVGDPLDFDAMPVRRPCSLAGLAPQMEVLCNALGNDIRLSLGRVYTPEKIEERLVYLRTKSGDLTGVTFKNFARESSDTEGDAENAIAVFHGVSMDKYLVGATQEPRARIEANNSVYMPMVNHKDAVTDWRGKVWGFGYDADGALERVSLGSASSGIKNYPIGLFYAHGGVGFNYGYAADPIGGELYHAKTIIARQDAAFTHTAFVRIGGWEAFFANRPEAFKRIGSNGELILGADEEETSGRGIPLDTDTLLHLDGFRQGARDSYYLNDGRLRVLRKRNIVSDDLETLHADAAEHLEAAAAAEEGRHWLLARAHSIFASNISNRVYGPLRGVTEDLVQAVVVLLLLNIPFAFAMERLIFGFPSIYKQVLGFAGFFLATFGILFVTHPAFSLASAPIVIFLAFVIILLSVITVAIVMGKIKQEIRAMQGLASTVHGMESDSSTSLAAILIGISGMRNRPLKTFLTSVTVVLLTFTILVFASFTSRQGVVETYLGRGDGPDRIELHRFSFLDIDKSLVESVETLYSDRFRVFRRGGLFRNPTIGSQNGSTPLAADRVLYLPRTGKTFELGCIMGVDPAEYAFNPELARVAPGLAEGDDAASSQFAVRSSQSPENPENRNPEPGEEKPATGNGKRETLAAGRPAAPPPIYLPELSAKTLEAEIGDVVLLNGTPYRYVGMTDGAALQGLSLIDDFKVMPPDFSATVKNTGRTATDGMSAAQFEEMDTGSFEWFSSDKVAVARIADLERDFRWSCFVNLVFLYPRHEGVDLETAGRELAPVFHGSVHCKSSEGARRLFFTKAVAGSGFGDVVIPLLLGGLIIFSSLMGSIVDREREIFTYSALGLSPPDVGALFFAESAVYSVIGGMGGYLLSQVVAKILNALGRAGVITPPEMNFSSLTSVLTILIVMAVVMLSTIFPALKAGKSANPGVARRWKMPAPKGNRLDFVFPFTVSETDFTGILSFIREHFQNHSDATLGAFAARDVKLFRLPGAKNGRDAYGIEAGVSLAPFDLGIFQKFRMYSSEFEIKGIDEVVVELERIGGTPTAWIRSNRAFADELRQQFLLWRSLPIETIEHYRAETRKTLGLD